MTEHNNPQDNVTVPRELLREVIDAACSPYCAQDLGKLIPALRTALEQPAVEPRISTKHCSLAERQQHQASVNYPSEDLYCPRCKCSEKFLHSRACDPHIVYDAAAPKAQQPAVEQRMNHTSARSVGDTDPSTSCGSPTCGLIAPQVQQPAQVVWGVDWGSHGDRSCVSIIKKHANGVHEVVATEYGPIGSAPQAQPAQESELVDVAWRTNVAMAVYNQARRELNNSIGSWISNHIGSWVSFEIDERQRIMDAIKPFMPAPQAQPRKAVKLSDYELVSHYCAIADGKEWAIGGLSDAVPFARAVEQAVLKKNGVTE